MNRAAQSSAAKQQHTSTGRARLRLVVVILPVAAVLLFFASGGSFRVDEDLHAAGRSVKSFDIPANLRLDGRQLRDTVPFDSAEPHRRRDHHATEAPKRTESPVPDDATDAPASLEDKKDDPMENKAPSSERVEPDAGDPMPPSAAPTTSAPPADATTHREQPSLTERDLLTDFVNDPSMPVRCKETAAPALPQCDSFHFERREHTVPALVIPFSTGPTTANMKLRPATEVLHNDKVRHHPIFDVYANSTAVSKTHPKRVLEFNGVHTDYDFDCEAGVDFRLYHQCRAALCLEHETRLSQSADDEAAGQFPLVDEEYMEYVMTLTTAYEAARSGANYTFIELGARYGTWIVRAGVSYQSFDPVGQLRLLAVEGNCKWFRKMEEHVRCNHLEGPNTKLLLSYAAPKSYNKVRVGAPATYNNPRAVSLLEMLPIYDFVDMIDFDIQGFEWLALEEPGVLPLMAEKIGFAHFGTHSTEIEKRVITAMQQHGWCVVYFYAGAHTKKLDKGHRCETPFGPSVFNDGVLGLANLRFYPNLKGKCRNLLLGNLKSVARTCHHNTEMVTHMLERNPHNAVH